MASQLPADLNSHFKHNTPISAQQLVQLIETNKTGSNRPVLLIDVRNPDEHAAGIIPTATKLPLPELQQALSLSPDQFMQKYQCALPSNKDACMIMYCKAGGRAEKAVEIAKQLGYQSMVSVPNLLIDRWRARLADLSDVKLPTDYPVPTNGTKAVDADFVMDIPVSISRSILALSISHQSETTPFHILLSAFAILLARFSGEQDITLGSATAVHTPGSMPENLVLRLHVDSSASFLTLIDHVVNVEQQVLNDPIPFKDLSSLITNQQNDPVSSLFKVRFFNAIDTNPSLLSTQGTATDLTVFLTSSQSLRSLLPISVRIVYNACLFSLTRIHDLAKQFVTVLSGALASPQTPIGKISLVSQDMASRLPDPTIDLNWHVWPGPIHQVFARVSATVHPDTACIVDQNLQSKKRIFTYTHINQAANQVANRLIKAGIKPEHVVMLYSARCVELVVAILGVLKAGATFSVIDPAYPPERQTVYLSVAKPVGLIILSQAGTLDASVRNYIATQLNLIVEISPLKMSDSGSLIGTDICEMSSSNPDISIGPDNIGTLSFTSGSTGTPKGVRGRHFSLTHYTPWMAHKFKLSASDRFTMLSGIAHDPIQRDIFTPLFLGASLYIPNAEDIGTPGALAKWMDLEQITVTHLTPAMGQLITATLGHFDSASDHQAGAVTIPSLSNAFFVGDILTKRDVSRLQHLAPNCTVINMYGTTETQRSVSYLKVPPRATDPNWLTTCKDIIPAGQGMHNVQLLVINSQGMLCGVGEVGELYVRAGGLAEEYLGLPEVSNEKFLPNPFAKSPVTLKGEFLDQAVYGMHGFRGPRDRIYRTGDVGRYLTDGSVECAGRKDDQVKLRGFRIELGEIDMYLSQHPQIRENVSLVRRDKDEEPTLIAYLVLHSESTTSPVGPSASTVGRIHYLIPDDWMDIQKDIRQYLRTKLPAYAVPTVLCPLRALPLTPNGKIDKNALPFPDTGKLLAPATQQISTANADEWPFKATQLRQIWAKVLNVPEAAIQLMDNFFEIGGHSVAATRLVLLIRRDFGIANAPLSLVFETPVLKNMAACLDDLSLDISASRLSLSTSGGSIDNAEGDEVDYAKHVQLPAEICIPKDQYPVSYVANTSPTTVCVTGATGFLGTFIVAQLLEYNPDVKVICIVRAKSKQQAMDRIVQAMKNYAIWSDEYINRVTGVCGDLGALQWGLGKNDWDQLANEVDVIIHNGAMVHWVFPYSKLAPANVGGTIEALKLSVAGNRIKPVHFVSSTSVLDAKHYTDNLAGTYEVKETDALNGSRTGLKSGYAQTKWVAEQLCAEAWRRGIPVTVIRPGFIVGHSKLGITNPDDFIWRFVKGCIELGKCPNITNVVNMCPADYVAHVAVTLALHHHPIDFPDTTDAQDGSVLFGNGSYQGIYGRVYHTYNPENYRFNDLLVGCIQKGWPECHQVPYLEWRQALLEYTLVGGGGNALYPLLHFVLDDLPSNLRAPRLSTVHTDYLLGKSHWHGDLMKVPSMSKCVPLAYSYLIQLGFLPHPPPSTMGHSSSSWLISLNPKVLAVIQMHKQTANGAAISMGRSSAHISQ